MKYITIKDVANNTNLSERTIRNYCIHGNIPGSIFNGKCWLIPENYNICKETTDYVDECLNFIDNSPVSFFAVNNIEKELVKKGYRKITNQLDIKKGDKVYFTRNGTSLIAFNVGSLVNEEEYCFHIIASHSDSPTFKVKPVSESIDATYNKINVEPYGGMICSTWLDRPLSLAGRVIVKDGESLVTKLVNIDEDLLMIPNLCIHFNRDANSGYNYDMAVDMQPFMSQALDKPLLNKLATILRTNPNNIVNFDLYLYNRQKAIKWGAQKEYVSSGRLDDLECVFTSSKAFLEAANNNAINVLYISDNEEVGSSSAQGADTDFLRNSCKIVANCLDFSKNSLISAFSRSFLISADNAHAVHPNKANMTDSDNKVFMNKGIAIKSNASQRYTSDSLSSSIFAELCTRAGSSYQYFTNKSNVRGGSTLGNILLTQIGMLSVDIGLPQLAMHSAYETAGADDIAYAVRSFREFYLSDIKISDDKIEIKRA